MANAKIKHLQLPNGTTYDFHAVTADSATKASQDGSGNTTYVKKSGDTMTGVLTMGGNDFRLGTSGTSSDDSADIAWYYGNGQEKARLWTANEYTAKSGLNYRVYKKDGTSLYSGTIPLADGTGASGTWGISVSGNAATATKATQDGDGNTIKSTYLKLSGGTMTGAITFANGVKNIVGDDSAIGDCNIAGTLGLVGVNGTTGLAFFLKDTTWGSGGNYAKFSYDGTSMSLSKPFNIQGTNASWLATGQSPTVYVKKSSGSGALGAYSVDTKTGRFVLSTYPSYDDLVYFNWFSDTTLAGTTNTVDKQFTWTPSTNTLSVNISGTASKLGSATVGSATKPIYLNGGTATACTYSLNKTVPSDAVFTDTNTHRPIQINGTEILGNNTTALNLKAGSNVLVTNTNGTVTIEATDTDTTYTLSADTTNNKIKLTPSSGFTQSITVPYASSAGSAGRVSISTANPETDTYYMPIFRYGIGDTDTSILYEHSNDYTYYLRKGTTSRIGESALILGNDVSSGTDGNSRGELILYSEGSVRSALMMTNTNIGSSYNHYLPAVAGTIGVFTVTPTSGQVVVTDGTAGGFKTTGYTIAKSVPSDAVFTDHYAWTDITGKPSSFTPASHIHGNIQNGGTLQTNDITIASGDKLVVTDSSDSSKVARTSISFDGSTTTKCLTQKGTWATFGTSNLTLGTTASTALKGDTKYAGASTAGGSATSAAKLDTSTAGSATQPCYFANGVPSACTYSLNKSVPSDAVQTLTVQYKLMELKYLVITRQP